MNKIPKRKKIKVEFKNGWLYVNGFVAQLFSPLEEVQDGYSGYGDTGRVIYQYGNILIKFNDSHWQQTKTEIKLWKQFSEDDRKYFGRVLDWDDNGQWIAVEKEDIRQKETLSKKNQEILCYLIDKYKLNDIFLHYKNNRAIRKKDGTLIIYDWGLQDK